MCTPCRISVFRSKPCTDTFLGLLLANTTRFKIDTHDIHRKFTCFILVGPAGIEPATQRFTFVSISTLCRLYHIHRHYPLRMGTLYPVIKRLNLSGSRCTFTRCILCLAQDCHTPFTIKRLIHFLTVLSETSYFRPTALMFPDSRSISAFNTSGDGLLDFPARSIP